MAHRCKFGGKYVCWFDDAHIGPLMSQHTAFGFIKGIDVKPVIDLFSKHRK